MSRSPNAHSRIFAPASLALVLLTACTAVGTGEREPVPVPVPEGPALMDGPRDMDEARAAARLMAEGEALLRDDDAEGARERAVEAAERYPTAVGSARALWLQARADRRLERWDEAEEAVSRYLDLAPADDPIRDEVSLMRARIRWEGELGGEVEALFAVPQGSRSRFLEEAQALAFEVAQEMETPLLRDLIREAPRHPHVLPAFLVELAIREYMTGNQERGREFASRALGMSPTGDIETRARDVLEGRFEATGVVSVVLGALLPESSSPALQELAARVRDGVELAVSLATERDRGAVRFLPMDDQGEAHEVSRGVRLLESQGALGIIGPVLEPLLEEAVRSRSTQVPIISPTARSVPGTEAGVYSLAAAEPGPPRMLARMALSREVETAVVFHPSSPDMFAQAWWFQEAFEAGGGRVLRAVTYLPRTTSFEGPLGQVVEAEPDALILFLPPEDVEMIAPQIAYWGVDDLEDLIILGNESWSSPQVLDAVPTRHTNGVLTVSSREMNGDYGPGWSEFVEAYEAHFMRGLRSPVAALGYDAARLLMEAARSSDGTPEGMVRSLERIRDFPGATGLLSVVDGRIQRAYLPVEIQNRRLVPVVP